MAVLTLNRPERLNAWTPALQTRLFDLLDECAADPDVRAIVVTGAGRGFCAGADMQGLQDLAGGGPDGAVNGGAGGEAPRVDERPVRHPLSIPKPIVAAINGPCAGIGLALALMFDVRFAAADAKLTTAFSRRGLVAEHGIAWMLPRLIGPARALDLLLSGRVILGREAQAMGLVNQAHEDGVLEHALDYADELARQCSPASMAAMKRQVYADLELGLGESVDTANRLMVTRSRLPTSPKASRASWSGARRTSRRWRSPSHHALTGGLGPGMSGSVPGTQMRVLLISWEYPPVIEGGLGRHVRKLSEHLVAAGVEVHVLTRGGGRLPAHEVRHGVVRASRPRAAVPARRRRLRAVGRGDERATCSGSASSSASATTSTSSTRMTGSWPAPPANSPRGSSDHGW